MRWLLERYEFPFEVVYPQTLDAGNLASRFDVIILASDAVAVARTSLRARRRAGCRPSIAARRARSRGRGRCRS